MEISIYTNRHGHRNYGLVLSRGSKMVELLLDPFLEFSGASDSAKRSRIAWVTPVFHTVEGPGTRIYPYEGQRIPWQTPEIPQILASRDIESRREELYKKYYVSNYSQRG